MTLDIYLRTKIRSKTGRAWVATATVGNRLYHVVSWEGASNKLAAKLRAEGVPDQPIKIHNPSGTDFMSYPSLYDWADFDFQKLVRDHVASIVHREQNSR